MDTQDSSGVRRCLHLSVDGSEPRPIQRLGEAEFANAGATGRVAIFARSAGQEASKGFAFDGRGVQCGMLLEFSPKRSLDDCDVFVGIQIPGRVALTRGARWATKILLKVSSAWAPVHSSIGSSAGADQEYAHIVLHWSNWPCVLDHFEVAPSCGKFDVLKPGYTYTWEYGSSIIDLRNWRLVNLPLLGSFPFARLWGDLPLEIVVYAVRRGGRHLVGEMSYLANVQLSLMDQE